MATYLCLKNCGLFRQGRTYHFEKPTAQALSAARGGFLKPLAAGGFIKPDQRKVVGESTPELVIPAKKRGRPRKAVAAALQAAGELAGAVGEAVEEAL